MEQLVTQMDNVTAKLSGCLLRHSDILSTKLIILLHRFDCTYFPSIIRYCFKVSRSLSMCMY